MNLFNPSLPEIEKIRELYEKEQLGFREVAVRLGVPPWRIYRLMKLHSIPRRRGSEQNYATYKTKPQFKINEQLTAAEEQLKIAGAMLYWAEGVKTGKTVDFANCDPELVELFVAFLRRICGVAESRLRVLLYAYQDQNIGQLRRFWAKITGIPIQQFTQPYVRPLREGTNGRKMPYGLVHIRYNDFRLLKLILGFGKSFSQSWTGAGVVNRNCL